MKKCRAKIHEYDVNKKQCPFCAKARRTKDRDKNRHKTKNLDLKRVFNITIEKYNEMLKLQNGVCAICNKTESVIDVRTNRIKDLAVDHNHSTGQIRGLLCWKCNSAYGSLKESEQSILNMLKYHIKYNNS